MNTHGTKTTLLAIALPLLLAAAGYGADVKENWEKHCAKCHGADGKGGTKMGQKLGAKDYTDPKVQAELKDDRAFTSIKDGLKDKNGKVLMKPAEALTDDEIKALVSHIRQFKK